MIPTPYHTECNMIIVCLIVFVVYRSHTSTSYIILSQNDMFTRHHPSSLKNPFRNFLVACLHPAQLSHDETHRKSPGKAKWP